MQRPAARVGVVAQRLAAEGRAQIAKQRRGGVCVRLVEFEEAEAAGEDVARNPVNRSRASTAEKTLALAEPDPVISGCYPDVGRYAATSTAAVGPQKNPMAHCAILAA